VQPPKLAVVSTQGKLNGRLGVKERCVENWYTAILGLDEQTNFGAA
jgi:hypothetical protein